MPRLVRAQGSCQGEKESMAWPSVMEDLESLALYRTEGPAVGMGSNLVGFGSHEVQRKEENCKTRKKIGRKSCNGQGEKEWRSSGSQRTSSSGVFDKDSEEQ